MGEFLRSALDYIGGGQGGPAGKDESDLVGNVVEIENRKFRVKRLLAEGGFAYVYVVQDVETGKDYALKRLLAHDEEAAKNIKQEIRFLRTIRLKNLDHRVKFAGQDGPGVRKKHRAKIVEE